MSPEDPKVLFVLYYKSPPHSFELIQRAESQLEHFYNPVIRLEAIGTPAETLNFAVKAHQERDGRPFDWVVPFDPHLLWEDGGVEQFMEDLEKADANPSIGYVSYPVYQHGPQVGVKDWLGEPKHAFFRLLAAFRVKALHSVGGFSAATSGRNWMWRTEMAITDQGWHHLDSGVCVARHHDPDLTLQYHLEQAFMSGRDAMDLYHHNRGHPLIHEGTNVLAGKVALMSKRNWDNVYWQCIELLRILGGGESLDRYPKTQVQASTLQLWVHEEAGEKP